MSLVTLFGITFDTEKTRAESHRIAEAAISRLRAAAPTVPTPMGADRSEIIVLPGGGTPEFQFDEAMRVRPLVAQVNRLLDAEHDPWGVLDFYACETSAGRPLIELVGTSDETLVLDAARRLLSD